MILEILKFYLDKRGAHATESDFPQRIVATFGECCHNCTS